MGYVEALKRFPYFVRLGRRVRAALRDLEVDLVLPVDYPGFNMALARDAARLGIPVLYFIAPQVWAWKETRAARLAETCDRVLTVFPFEEALLARYGVSAGFVGHPLMDEPAEHGAKEPRLGSDTAETLPVLGLFPGSRRQEVERHLRPFVEAARLVRKKHPDLEVRIARPEHLEPALYEEFGLPTGTAADIIRVARAAITKSGTITLELALAGVPMVVGYRTSRATYAAARRVLRIDTIVLANLVTGERFVPELIQDDVTPEALARATLPLLDEDSAERAHMTAGLRRVRASLGEPGCARRVADEACVLLAAPC